MSNQKKKSAIKKRRGGKVAARRARAGVGAPELLPIAPATGVRLLRERLGESGVAKLNGEIMQALTWLEAEYNRVQEETGTRVFLQNKRVVSTGRRQPGFTQTGAEAGATYSRPQVSFVPTPSELVTAIVELAKVTKDDIVYDLGCGDGRIVIAAAKQFGARGVGIDIDPQRIEEAVVRASEEGVSERVSFRQLDMFEADLHDATVVTLYLLPAVNIELRSLLLAQLRPGTRIASLEFNMGDWRPAETREVDGRRIYLWIVPDAVA
jgi:SAM-dependent methyltransferase